MKISPGLKALRAKAHGAFAAPSAPFGARGRRQGRQKVPSLFTDPAPKALGRPNLNVLGDTTLWVGRRL